MTPPTPPPPTSAPSAPALARFVSTYGQEIVIACAIVALFVVVSAINPRFLGANNLNTIISGNAYIAVAAIGMSMIIITGHIDVSVGALIGVLATISGTLAVSGYPIWVAWTAPILIGAAVNGVVGALVAYGRLPSIVVTLGMLSILRGGLVSVTGGAWINNLPPAFQLAQARWFGVPAPIWFMVILTILAFLWMKNTAFGRSLYAIGGNAEAARAAGIPVERRTVQVFMIHGAFAGIATMLFATQLKIIQSTVPPNLELTIITASVIGGVSILGGTGTVIGSTLAAILFAAIGSAMIFVNVSAYWLRAVIGVLILVTVLVDMAAAQPRDAERQAMTLRRLLRHETILALLVVLALFVLDRQSDRFFTVDNLLNQGRLMTEVGLIAVIMTFVIITGGIDLSVGSILGMTAILIGVFWKNIGLPLPVAIGLAPRRRHLRGLRQRRHHHPLPRAAADRHPRHAGALPRHRRGRLPGPLGARLPRLVLRPRPGRGARRPDPALAPRPRRARSRRSCSPTPPGAAPPTPSARTRSRRASPASTSTGPRSPSTPPPASPPRSPAAIFVSRVSTTRSDMGTGIELDAITAVVLGGTSIFGGRGTIVGTLLGLILIQALKNGLSLAGVKSDGTVVLIGAVLILTILISNLFHRDGNR